MRYSKELIGVVEAVLADGVTVSRLLFIARAHVKKNSVPFALRSTAQKKIVRIMRS